MFRRALLVLLGCLLPGLPARADVAVIVHPESPVRTLTAREVSDLYLGRVRGISVAGLAQPVTPRLYEPSAQAPVREAFFRHANGMSLRQVDAYWARLRFSGQVLPPVALDDSRRVIWAVGHDPSAIGYVDADAVDPSVRVVLRFVGP